MHLFQNLKGSCITAVGHKINKRRRIVFEMFFVFMKQEPYFRDGLLLHPAATAINVKK